MVDESASNVRIVVDLADGHEPNADAKPVEVDHIELNVAGEKRY